MRKWEYDVSFHSLEDLGISEEDVDFPKDQIISCDEELDFEQTGILIMVFIQF